MKPLILLLATATIVSSCSNHTSPEKDAIRGRNDVASGMTGPQDDKRFMAAAADGGMMEVALGKLAQTNAASQQVKDFGSMMMSDHSAANDELKQLAQKKNIAIPSALSDKNQKDYDDLAKKRGVDFDKAYAGYMVGDHKDDIEAFKKEADKGDDADIKAWAAGKVPVLQHHLQMAEAARDALK